MFSALLGMIFQGLSNGFDVAIDLFDGLELSWLKIVTTLVLISLVLRLFTAQFVGSAIHSGAESLTNSAREHRTARKENRRLDRMVKKEARRIKRSS